MINKKMLDDSHYLISRFTKSYINQQCDKTEIIDTQVYGTEERAQK